jgi:hypothetical protein
MLMPLVGNLRDFALHDFLYLVAHGNKSGSLWLQSGGDEARLYFEQGKLLSVLQPRRAERLGELLLRVGKISLAQLHQALDAQKTKRGTLLGSILVEQGAISEAELQASVQMFIERVVYDLIAWREGVFEWHVGQRPAPDQIQTPVPLAVENLVMEGVRRVDEMTRIRERIPTDDAVVRATPLAATPEGEVNLTAAEWRVFACVDDQRSVADIAERLNLTVFEVSTAIFALIVYGIVEVEAGANEPHAAMPVAVV